MSRSGDHDRRLFDVVLKLCLGMVVASLLLMIFYSIPIGLTMLIFSCMYFIHIEMISGPPPNNPREFTAWSHKQYKRRPTLLCLGDSLTHGKVSSNITPEIPIKLASMLGMETPVWGLTFNDPIWVVNAGQNFLTSHVILHERLSKAMGTFPDYVYLMIGTNDILGIWNKMYGNTMAYTHTLLDGEPSMKTFERNIRDIVNFIRESSPLVELGVCTIPPLGEDLNSDVNRIVKEANRIIERIIVAEKDERTTLLPIFERMETVLEKSKSKKRGLSMVMNGIYTSTMLPIYQVFPVSLNTLSKHISGYTLHTDGVHLNEAGRDIIVDCIIDWLRTRNIAKIVAVKSL